MAGKSVHTLHFIIMIIIIDHLYIYYDYCY